jgi:hypothetical protein
MENLANIGALSFIMILHVKIRPFYRLNNNVVDKHNKAQLSCVWVRVDTGDCQKIRITVKYVPLYNRIAILLSFNVLFVTYDEMCIGQ